MQKFDVFGKVMGIGRTNNGWQLFTISTTGTRIPVNDVVIPADLSPMEFERFLDDLYHEQASDRHRQIIPL